MPYLLQDVTEFRTIWLFTVGWALYGRILAQLPFIATLIHWIYRALESSNFMVTDLAL